MNNCDEMTNYHDKLIKMLNVQSKVCNINKHCAENQECTIDDKDKVQEGPEIVGEAAAAA